MPSAVPAALLVRGARPSHSCTRALMFGNRLLAAGLRQKSARVASGVACWSCRQRFRSAYLAKFSRKRVAL
eukprot:9603741-Alexandrium_andersonii.AAC.1